MEETMLSQACNFSLDVQDKTQRGVALNQAITESQANYAVISAVGKSLTFNDGSTAVLIDEGFILLEKGVNRSLEEGEAALNGQCEKCGWNHAIIFTVGDEEREAAHSKLETFHESMKCSSTLEFIEKPY